MCKFQKLTQDLNEIRIQSTKNNNEIVKLEFTNNESETVLTVGKKEFNHSNHQDLFLSPAKFWVIIRKSFIITLTIILHSFLFFS